VTASVEPEGAETAEPAAPGTADETGPGGAGRSVDEEEEEGEEEEEVAEEEARSVSVSAPVEPAREVSVTRRHRLKEERVPQVKKEEVTAADVELLLKGTSPLNARAASRTVPSSPKKPPAEVEKEHGRVRVKAPSKPPAAPVRKPVEKVPLRAAERPKEREKPRKDEEEEKRRKKSAAETKAKPAPKGAGGAGGRTSTGAQGSEKGKAGSRKHK
jgi:hypothetical protein